MEKVDLLDFEYCSGHKSPINGGQEGRVYLFFGRQVEQQVRLEEGLGTLVEECDLLRQETGEKTGGWVRVDPLPITRRGYDTHHHLICRYRFSVSLAVGTSV